MMAWNDDNVWVNNPSRRQSVRSKASCHYLLTLMLFQTCVTFFWEKQ